MELSPPITEATDKRALLARLLRERAQQNTECPLSTGQLRLWRIHGLDSDSPVYNIAIAYRLTGQLHADALVAAIREVATRHESFRASIVADSKGPRHKFDETIGQAVDRIDARAITAEEWPAALARIETEAASRLFDLSAAPLWHFTLVERSDREHILIVVTHHIMADRWSIGLFVQELAREYSVRIDGNSTSTRTDRLPYPEAMRRLEPSPHDELMAASKAVWGNVFSTRVPDLRLPTDRTPRTAPSYHGIRKPVQFDASFSAAIDTYARDAGVTPYVVFLSALAISLHADTEQDDLVIVTPVSGRHRAATRGVLGYFNNLLPVRLDLADLGTFRRFVGEVEGVTRQAFSHQDVPFANIAELPGLNHTNLARCLFSLQNTTSLQLELPEIESTYEDVSNQTSNFDLALFIESHENAYRGFFDAKTDFWSEGAIDRFVARFQTRLIWLLQNAEKSLGELPAQDFDTSAISPLDASAEGFPNQSNSPRNELERRMIELWEQVLEIQPLGPASNFFEVGGHSLVAARLIERIGREIGRELPLTALLHAPTIREFSQLIADGDDAPCWASLVSIQAEGSRPPFFCVHGGGGGVLTFSHFKNVLGLDQPLYGLQSPRSKGANGPETVEELAEVYLRAIREIQPDGPYYLSGHSFGGLIAYEMAKRLTAVGETVAFLAILDHPGPDVKITLRDKISRQLFMMAQLDFKQRCRYIFDRVTWAIRRNEHLPLFLRKAALVWVAGRRDWNSAEHRLKSITTALKALDQYKVTPYPGPLSLFRARHGGLAINCDAKGGWGKSALGGVEVFDLFCGHMQMVEQPHLGTLASYLQSALLRAQTAAEHAVDQVIAASI